MRRPRPLVAALLAGALTLTAACGLGDKQARAERIIDAVDAAYDQGSAAGTITVGFEVVSLPPEAGDVGVEVGGADQRELAIPIRVSMDLRERTAFASYQQADKPFAAFDGIDLFGRRHNAGPRDARPWVFVEAEGLDRQSGGINGVSAPPFLGAFALNPVVVLDLASAPLTGSVELVGPEDIDGTPTTHYRANFDIEKMTRDTQRKRYPEKVRESLETLLALVSVKGTTHPGEVWVGDDGVLRRFRIKLRQEPFTEARFDLVLTLDLQQVGPPPDGGDGAAAGASALPTPSETVKVGTVLQFIGAAVPSPGSREFSEQVMGVSVGG